MRVGIDARRHTATGRGPERYVRCLVQALACNSGGHEYVLLADHGAAPARGLGSHIRFAPAARHLRLLHRRRLASLGRLLIRDLDLIHFPLADGWYRRVGRTVVTIHDLSLLRYPQAYFSGPAEEAVAWRHHLAITATAGAVIAVSDTTRRDVVDLLGVAPERVEVVPHGVEAHFRPVADPGVQERLRRGYGVPTRYLLFVGGVDFKKNVTRLVEGYAIARRRGRIRDVLVLVGPLQREGNPFFEAARQRAVAMGVEDHVVWAGYVPEADLPAMYSGADAFVFPSLLEGFGFPVLEAMACGTPVVTSAGTAMAEITEQAGVLVNPLDPEAIACGILEALEDGREGRRVQAGLRQAATYTWERTAVRTVEVYNQVTAGKRLGTRRALRCAGEEPVPSDGVTRLHGEVRA